MASFQEILSDVSSKVEGENKEEVKASLKQLGVYTKTVQIRSNHLVLKIKKSVKR